MEVLEKERRYTYENDSRYNQLSLAQKMAASQVRQFGFELKFIRSSNTKSLAIFSCNSKIITIDSYGEIEMYPKIKLRNE